MLEGLATRWRGAVQETISDGLESGRNPLEVASHLAGRVNLQTGQREGALIIFDEADKEIVFRFREVLTTLDQSYFQYDLRDKRFDQSVQRAILNREPITEQKIVLLVYRFEAKLLKRKADLIARTEMLASMHRSEWLSIKSSMERNNLPEESLTRIWKTCCKDDVRPSHKALHGTRIIGLERCFISPVTGARMMYPGDRSLGASEGEVEGCRCRIQYETDFLYGVT